MITDGLPHEKKHLYICENCHTSFSADWLCWIWYCPICTNENDDQPGEPEYQFDERKREPKGKLARQIVRIVKRELGP